MIDSGFSIFLMENSINRFFQSIFEKYPDFSPYAVCGNNPLVRVDKDGRKWDTDESITNTNEKALEDLIAESDMLRALFKILQDSEATYVLRMGETSKNKNGESNPGEFNPKDGVITLDKNRQFSMQTLVEEMYHAYQKDSGSLESFNNQEFEAKVATTAIMSEGGASGGILIGDEFHSKIVGGSYGNENNAIKPFNVSFSKDYMMYGKQFSINNMVNNIGNIHYSTPVTKIPQTLTNLIQKAYGK